MHAMCWHCQWQSFNMASKICGHTNRLQEFEVLPQESGTDLGLKMLSALSAALQLGATKVSNDKRIVLFQIVNLNQGCAERFQVKRSHVLWC